MAWREEPLWGPPKVSTVAGPCVAGQSRAEDLFRAACMDCSAALSFCCALHLASHEPKKVLGPGVLDQHLALSPLWPLLLV